MCSIVRKPPVKNVIDDLISEVLSLRNRIEQRASIGREALSDLPPERHPSADNLLYYLALRGEDIRQLQRRLTRVGMSSLGGVEPHVMATINAILHNLYMVSKQEQSAGDSAQVYAAFNPGVQRLESNTINLFGNHPKNRRAHIIVTLSAEVADDYMMVHQLLKSGTNCMRINCAHDDSEIWLKMIKTVRNAQRATGLPCRILMDLGGPKLRIGAMKSKQAILKIKPIRASDGSIQRPARIWLAKAETSVSEMPAADASFVVDQDWLAAMVTGDRISLRDIRGSKRNWRVREVLSEGCWAESKKTSYVGNGTILSIQNDKADAGVKTQLTSLAEEKRVCLIRTGDILFISNTDQPGKPASHDPQGELLNPGRLSLAVPEVYREVRPGDPLIFDDGRICGIVEKQSANQLQVRITQTIKAVEKLEGGRGVNLPGSDLNLPALGKKDLQDIEFAARHTDMIGLSFANEPSDVRALHQHLQMCGRPDIGIILKIETKRGFSNLPAMLLEALNFSASGVMIARGDLAVECGFERMSEIQEEILWVCESAHIPVIWATQVLEGLTKNGQVSRAEVTDAAMSQAAEAVMLNKGPHIIEAVEMLDNILQRMQGHHQKTRSILRELHLATEFYSRL
jgi:pyruvate kinase